MKMLRLFFSMLVCTAFLITGCQEQNSDLNDKDDESKESEVLTDDAVVEDQDEPISDMCIEIRSASELEKMREMANNTDNKALEAYFQSSTSGVKSKEELVQFVDLVDSVPYISILEGDLTWIRRSSGTSIDTGEPYDILYISITSPDGEWIRIEYDLRVKGDVAKAIEEGIKQNTITGALHEPMKSKDKKVVVYAENRRAQTGGKTIWWTANIDGVYARIIYSTDKMETIDTKELLSKCKVVNVKSLIG